MIRYYLLYLILFTGLGAYNTFLPVYLENTLNLETSQIGVILSIPSIIGILFVPMWGMLSDVLKKRKGVLWFNILMTFIMTFVYIYSKSFFTVFIVAAFFEAFRNAILPLSDSLTTTYCKDNNKNYGDIRVIGSIFFAISAFLCGLLVDFTNKDVTFFYVFAMSLGLLLFLVPTLNSSKSNNEKSNDTSKTEEKINLKRDLPLLLKNKSYLLVILCGLCLNSLTEAIMSYQGIHLINLGASANLVGLLTTVMVIPELFLMVKTKPLVEKYGLINMLRVGSLALLIRWVLYFTTSNPFVFILATSMHGVSISIIIICAYDLISKIVDAKLFTTAMTVYTFIVGISYSFLKLVYGNVIQAYGIKPVFIFSIMVSLFSFVIFNKLKKMNLDSYNSVEIKIS